MENFWQRLNRSPAEFLREAVLRGVLLCGASLPGLVSCAPEVNRAPVLETATVANGTEIEIPTLGIDVAVTASERVSGHSFTSPSTLSSAGNGASSHVFELRFQ